MTKNTVSAVLCASFLCSITPVLAAPNEMPQGKRDEMSQKDTKREVTTQQKENKEATKNVDEIVKNRK